MATDWRRLSKVEKELWNNAIEEAAKIADVSFGARGKIIAAEIRKLKVVTDAK